MIVETNIRAAHMFRLIAKWIIIYLLLSIIVCIGYIEFGWRIAIPETEIAIMGTALSILMGFRVDAAYKRWWEARIIWGAVVNNSRTFAREVVGFLGKENTDIARTLIYRQIGFVESMGKHLRRQGGAEHLNRLLSPEDYDTIKSKRHVPNTLLMMNLKQLTELNESGRLNTYLLVQLETILQNLTDELGKAERIKNTPFPVPYGYFSWLLVHTFACLIPLAMVKELGYATLILAIIISFIFLIIEQIAIQIQDPFEGQPNDTPMTTIAKNIEIDLKEILGESPLPEPLTPKAGVSM
ncbi:bestrophin family protein [Olivibacter jilunii]|uniref:bestrophin family protein n=1 Tax=Olivibacter jilunii TaxID=985016 RepID=UPI0010322AA1|nr:bestrophin family ion channel [Olivibacter jilunii]